MSRLFFCILGLASVVCTASAQSTKRPNILYFYVDDMGWGSIGPNGQQMRREMGLPSVRTPNLDRLARQGMNFTRAYGCFVCSPARSSQQTGFHQGHTFADRNDPNNAKKAIRADDVTMGDLLSKAGYVTGYWGKWGYGGSKDIENPVVQNVQTLPTSHGYQHVLAELHHVRAHTFFQPTLWKAPAKPGMKGGLMLVPNELAKYAGDESYPNHPARQNDADYPDIAYCDDSYAFAALDFVRAQGKEYRASGKPFFGLLAVQIPHAPFGEIIRMPGWNEPYANDEFFDKLPAQAQQWAAMVTRIDAHFGNILNALDDPNQDGDNSDSIVADTLVIFQSDNGGPAGANNLSFDANGGLSGSKGKIQEGGIRVPLLMRWPGKIPPGATHRNPVDVTDLLPTFAELAGEMPPLGIDGVSLVSVLSGEQQGSGRRFLIHEAGNGHSIIQGDHKLVLPIRKKAKKSIAGKPKLFDLKKDPAETQDLADQHPQLVQQLRATLVEERVLEPHGFATTYHHWIGADGNDAAAAANWSNYHYENDGVTYMQEDGVPNGAWVARMVNEKAKPVLARLSSDADFLALELSGRTAQQRLMIDAESKLTARNELRLSQFAELLLRGGTIASNRSVVVSDGAVLSGFGEVLADVRNLGSIAVADGEMQISGSFRCDSSSTLSLAADSTIVCRMTAQLAGRLRVDGPPREIMRAKEISGNFDDLDLPTGLRLTQKGVSLWLEND